MRLCSYHESLARGDRQNIEYEPAVYCWQCRQINAQLWMAGVDQFFYIPEVAIYEDEHPEEPQTIADYLPAEITKMLRDIRGELGVERWKTALYLIDSPEMAKHTVEMWLRRGEVEKGKVLQFPER